MRKQKEERQLIEEKEAGALRLAHELKEYEKQAQCYLEMGDCYILREIRFAQQFCVGQIQVRITTLFIWLVA